MVANPEDSALSIYPLSPTFCLLARYLTYALLVFTLLAPSKSNLFKGSLAALTTKTALVAVHSLVLVHSTQDSQPLDLDIVGTWTILSLTSCFLPSFLRWSSALRGSKAVPVVRLWGVLIVAGTLAGYVNLRRARDVYGGEPGDVVGADGECHDNYVRRHEHSLVADRSRIFNERFQNMVDVLAPFVLVGAITGLYTCIRSPDASPQEKISSARRHDMGPSHQDCGVVDVKAKTTTMPELSTSTTRASDPWPVQRLGTPWAHCIEDPWSAFKTVVGWFTVFMPAIFIAQLVIQELYLLKGDKVPERESAVEVGQWGGWCGVGFVCVAAVIGSGGEKGRAGDEVV